MTDAGAGGCRRRLRRVRPRRRDPAPARRQDLSRRTARPVHDDAGRRSSRPVRGGAQRVRAPWPGEVRALARLPAHDPRARQQRRDQRRRASGDWSSRTAPRGCGSTPPADPPRAVAESGVPMARLATETQGAGLTGLEFGLAIPGSVGGAVWANAGAHDADVASVLESASVLPADGREVAMAAGDLDLGYRHSRFKETTRGGRPRDLGHLPACAGLGRRDQGAAWTRSVAGARHTSPSESRAPGRSSATRRPTIRPRAVARPAR